LWGNQKVVLGGYDEKDWLVSAFSSSHFLL
jgi:hypothetical protein